MFELSDTSRGLLAQEDMLRFRLKFSQGLTNASDEHVLAPINMKFYSVDFEPLGIRAMQTGEMQSGTHSGRAVCVLENKVEENKHFRQDVDPDVITVNRKPSVKNLTIVERSL
jgi:hypothetical protein